MAEGPLQLLRDELHVRSVQYIQSVSTPSIYFNAHHSSKQWTTMTKARRPSHNPPLEHRTRTTWQNVKTPVVPWAVPSELQEEMP